MTSESIVFAWKAASQEWMPLSMHVLELHELLSGAQQTLVIPSEGMTSAHVPASP